MQVSQTATVVGPEGEEIHVNERGQIKVQFHWDREGKNDQHSSCWIRTMQPWGGSAWGHQFIPRVGMEVVVTFEGGDTDRPIVLGSICNGTHPSPFPLPSAKTRSGFRTQSTPGGGGFNELSFEDAAANEQIYIHAQKNLDEVVENNHTVEVLNDERIRILGSRLDIIEKRLEQQVLGDHISRVEGNRIDVVTGNVDHRVTGALSSRVEGRERREVQGVADHVYSGDVTLRTLGSSTTIVGKADAKRSWVTHAEGTAFLTGIDRVELSSESELLFTVGKSSIRVTKDRIELSSSAIVTTGKGGQLAVDQAGLLLKSADTQMVMADRLMMNSGGASVTMGSEVKVDGKKILLNAPGRATEAPPPPQEPPTEILLVDQDGNGVPNQRFMVRLQSGAEIGGRTDNAGKAEMTLKEGGEVAFPDLAVAAAQTDGELKPYVVRQGDYLEKLAFMHGFNAEKVWNDSKNAELRGRRKSPDILQPGDLLYFPPFKGWHGRTLTHGSQNRYEVEVPKREVRIEFSSKGYGNARYEIHGLGAKVEGTTDGAGLVTMVVPVHVREVTVVFPAMRVRYAVRVGDLDPVTETSGVRQRLQQLGYRWPPEGDESEADLLADDRLALELFQKARGLAVTGQVDEATIQALLDAHRS